jgi:Protein of unknown function (DUF4229)
VPETDSERQQAAEPGLPTVPKHLGRDLALYVLARFSLVAVVAVILVAVHVPVLIGIAAGLVVGLPVSVVALRGWHQRLARGLAARGMVRGAERAKLRAELRGDAAEGQEPLAGT